MTDEPRRGLRVVVGVLIAGAVVAALALLVSQLQRAPEGPVPILWDEEVCAHCGMHIGEPGFAAQLQTEAGEVLSFDDPGCLLQMQADEPVAVRAVYFHHRSEDRWLRAPDVAFERVDRSPMGFGLGAVDPGTPGAISYAEARRIAAGPTASREEH